MEKSAQAVRRANERHRLRCGIWRTAAASISIAANVLINPESAHAEPSLGADSVLTRRRVTTPEVQPRDVHRATVPPVDSMPANFVISSRQRCGGPPPHGTSETLWVESHVLGWSSGSMNCMGGRMRLDAVPIRVAEVDKDTIGWAMPARSVLDVAAVSEVAGNVGCAEHGLQVGDDVGGVMQPWPGGLAEDEVMRIILAREETAQDRARVDVRGVLGRTESEFHAPGEQGGNIGDDTLVVVEPQHAAAFLRGKVIEIDAEQSACWSRARWAERRVRMW